MSEEVETDFAASLISALDGLMEEAQRAAQRANTTPDMLQLGVAMTFNDVLALKGLLQQHRANKAGMRLSLDKIARGLTGDGVAILQGLVRQSRG